MEKPTGTFECVICKKLWDGSELFENEGSTAVRWTCGDLTCGANVKKISNLPKEEYMAQQQ